MAIARALVNAPSLILADEPTGNLDSRTSDEIMAILQQLNRAGATIVLVTHEPDIATYCSRTVVFKDGVVVSDQPNRHIASAAEAIARRPVPADRSRRHRVASLRCPCCAASRLRETSIQCLIPCVLTFFRPSIQPKPQRAAFKRTWTPLCQRSGRQVESIDILS